MPTDPAFLHVAIQHRQGPLALDLDFALTQPWTILYGPSGSGKTTILRVIAGLLRPQHGHVHLHGKPLTDTRSRLFLPPHRRPIRAASQSARLFATMTVEQNIRYGIPPAPNPEPIAASLLQLFRLDHLAAQPPHTLSGGEQQRASVARAVAAAAATPSALLLLDEPFAGLGLAQRDTLALELKSWLHHHQTPVLSVTHNVTEAFLLNADVLRLDQGRITDQGPANRVLAPERQLLLNQLHT